MSTFENLFKIDSADGGLVLNKEELRAIPCFKPLVANSKEAKQSFTFVYLMADPRSIVSNLSPAVKEREAKKIAQLDEQWKPNALIKAAIAQYEHLLKLTPTGKSFLAANKALTNTGDDINSIMDSISYLKDLLKIRIAQLESGTLGDDETILAIKESKGLLVEILKSQGEAQNIIKGLPAMNKTVKDLATSWANEGSGKKEIHGGGELNSRES